MLVTNWHVVTGLDPANPTLLALPPPNFLKLTVLSRDRSTLVELSLPLYGRSMEPLWKEHSLGGDVDIVVYPLSLALEKNFEFVDINSAEDNAPISEEVAKDVFILGYPFSRDEMRGVFGEDAPYYIPIWKRGSIATEPALRFGKRVLLIDSLSRAGMSGAPIVIAQDEKVAYTRKAEDYEILRRMAAGEGASVEALSRIDLEALTEGTVKRFRFLGVYSGTIGSTRLAEVALGKCWHVEVLRELVANPRNGNMPAHAPLPNAHYNDFLAELPGDYLTIKNEDGEIIERIRIGQ